MGGAGGAAAALLSDGGWPGGPPPPSLPFPAAGVDAVYAVAALLCLAWAALALAANRRAWPAALACAATALWAGAAAVALAPAGPGPGRVAAALGGAAGSLEVVRTAAWAGALLALFARLGPAARRPVRGFAAAAAALAGAALALDLAGPGGGGSVPLGLASLGSPGLLARLALALVVLVLAENLWRNADDREAWHVNLPCIALGTLAALDVLLYADAALSGSFSPALLVARAGVAAAALALLPVAARRDRRWKPRPAAAHPGGGGGPAVSREAVFHGAALLISGAFLAGVGTVGEALRRSGAEWGDAAQAGLLAGAAMALAVALASGSVRSRIRRAVVDNLVAARFDYRREWLRCVATLSAGASDEPAERRAIRAVADAVDSPGGVLLLRGAEGGGGGGGVAVAPPLRWAGSWNAPSAPLPADAAEALRDRLRGGDVAAVAFGAGGASAAAPAAATAAYGPLWLAVGLPRGEEGLLGVVLLAPPRAPFPLDDEVFALLAALGREVALFLAEREAADRLAEQRRLADYAKRFAFVAHDVKTVSAQLRLMLDNAGPNIADPEFQQDLLTTLRASVGRIDALIARLRHDGAEGGDNGASPPPSPAPPPPPRAAVGLGDRLRAIARRSGHRAEVTAEDGLPEPAMPPENFDAAVTHLLNNAAEASPLGAAPVRLRAARDGPGGVVVEIEDSGPGMTAEFVRDQLFRPLATTKAGGSGIGAWQARELVAQAGGRLEVDSRPGAGTRVALRLPAAPAAAPAAAAKPALADAARLTETGGR